MVDAGFEDRIMFGTDQFMWPKLMAYSISIIQNADYLLQSKSATFFTATPYASCRPGHLKEIEPQALKIGEHHRRD